MKPKSDKTWLTTDPLSVFFEALRTTWGTCGFYVATAYVGNFLIVFPPALLAKDVTRELFVAPIFLFLGGIAIAGVSLVGWPLLAIEFFCIFSLLRDQRSRFWIFWLLVTLQFLKAGLVSILFEDARGNVSKTDILIIATFAAVLFTASFALRRCILKRARACLQ